MELRRDDAYQIAQQLQDAHRYTAGFYQRWVELTSNIATKFNLSFKFWKSLRFAPVPQKQTNPNQKWIWDFLPLCHSRFVYARETKNPVVLEIYFKPDPALDSKGWPNPFDLESKTPAIELHVFKPDIESNEVFTLWGGVENPKESDLIGRYENGLSGFKRTFDLAEFLMKPEQCIREVFQAVGIKED